MLDNFSEKLKTGYAEAKAKQADHLAHPTAAGSRNYFRQIGVMLFALGWVAAIINVISWYVVGRTLIIIVAAMLGLWGIGVWMMVTGKTIKKK